MKNAFWGGGAPISFAKRRDAIVEKLIKYDPTSEVQRDEFQKAIEKILKEESDAFYLLGDARYQLDANAKGEKDWRVRDINRLLTRYREDRPIKDAQRWARTALIVAFIALGSSLVSAVADLPHAWAIITGQPAGQ